MNLLRPILIAFALSFAALAPASAQDFLKASEALNRGDFATALREFRPLAEQGNALAQRILGDMYRRGDGIPIDPIEAVRWYRLAAEQGDAEAQFVLGDIHYHGYYGVSIDYDSNLRAYMWWDVAAAQGHELAKKERDKIVGIFNLERIAEAQTRSKRCRESGYRDCGEPEVAAVNPPEKTPPTFSQTPKSNPADNKPVLVGAGSGFTISKSGHLLTNQHVVDGCEVVTVHPPSGLKKAQVVATDDTNDLALLKTDLEDDNFIPISGTNVSLLEDVVVAGYPLSDSLSTTVKVTKGVVSSLAGLGNDYSKIQIDAAVQKGNSGGPILNELGNVVAVTVSTLNKEYFLKEKGTIPENTNFGIKSSTARAFVDANGVRLPQPYSRPMSRRDMADLITKTTHLVGCWVSRATAQKMASDQKQELSVTPTMQRQVEALR